jgi:hypothetical protein
VALTATSGGLTATFVDGVSLRAMNRRPQLTITAPDATPEEAAAVAAALERFMRDTAPTPAAAPPEAPRMSAWKRAALAEGVSRRPELFR